MIYKTQNNYTSKRILLHEDICVYIFKRILMIYVQAIALFRIEPKTVSSQQQWVSTL